MMFAIVSKSESLSNTVNIPFYLGFFQSYKIVILM